MQYLRQYVTGQQIWMSGAMLHITVGSSSAYTLLGLEEGGSFWEAAVLNDEEEEDEDE
jgi:hypothetical protein